MDDQRDTGERLAAIETLMVEREKTGGRWRGGVDKKLDEIIKNGKNLATTKSVKDAIVAHASSCIKGSNPGPGGKVDMFLKGYRVLGMVGCLLVMNGLLIVVVLKLVGAF